ncbi:enoyl-CoA hydratase-related protein, partial [Sphingomonas sp.]|uniref:enoyl-CoA hydratase-related protein n=1 Tax=Sphingomonas sp. TaxID=28214 RepID=UPI003B3AF452
AFASDFRIAATGARFGSPLARTIGNCLSARGYARLVQHAGIAIAKRMLLGAEIVAAEEMKALGLINVLADPAEIDAAVDALVERLLTHAPLTMAVSKEAIRRVSVAGQPDISDLIATIYGSADFAEGVRSFLAKEKPRWQGR